MPDISTCGEAADFFAAQPRDRRVVIPGHGDDYQPLGSAEEGMFWSERTGNGRDWTGQVFDTPEEAERIEKAGGLACGAPDGAERVAVMDWAD